MIPIQAGTILNEIFENTEINVDAEIVGKKTYKTSTGFDLSKRHEIKIFRQRNHTKYADGEWYVEGVGDKIQLIKQEDRKSWFVYR